MLILLVLPILWFFHGHWLVSCYWFLDAHSLHPVRWFWPFEAARGDYSMSNTSHPSNLKTWHAKRIVVDSSQMTWTTIIWWVKTQFRCKNNFISNLQTAYYFRVYVAKNRGMLVCSNSPSPFWAGLSPQVPIKLCLLRLSWKQKFQTNTKNPNKTTRERFHKNWRPPRKSYSLTKLVRFWTQTVHLD